MKTYVFDPQGPDRFSVAPSDMGQAALRVVLVSIVVLWSYFRSDGTIADKITTSAHFQFALLYLLISLTLLAWTRYASQRASASYHSIIATRVLSIFTDISAVSIYTALSGPEGIILYPIYITSSIGYGYRFGVRYLYLALVVSASSFSIVLRMNPFIADNTSLIVAFYLGIILVPLYAAMLLNKHQLVLDRLKEVNAARSRFIANMSHEFRTPLHAIISGADLLREESQTNVVSQQRGSSQKLQLISEAGEHLLSLVNRVLDVASAEAGFPIGRSVDIIELYAPILSALKICQASAEKKGIQFSWFFDIDVPVEIETSSEMLKEIVINTVGNAVKYTVEGYVQVNVSMAAKETDSWLRIEVIDTGIGISSKLIPNIFEPFTLGDDSASRRFPGTGLGLTLTKKYVDRLGGTISFNSSRSTGTQCTIELPLNIPSSGSAHTSNVDFKEIGCIVYAEDLAAAALLERRLPGASVAEMTNISESIKHVPRSIGLVVLFVEDESLQESWSCGLHVRYPGAMLALCGSTRVTSLEPSVVNTWFDPRDACHIARLHRMALATKHLNEGVSPLRSKQKHVPAARILIADDNPVNLRTAKLALASEGHELELVDNGEAALSALEKSQFNLAFIDLHMPLMSGLDVLQMYEYFVGDIRTPIVVLTADVTESSRHDALAAGAVAVLNKPLRIRDLREAVSTYAIDACDRTIASQHADDEHKAIDEDDIELIDPSVIHEFVTLGISHDEIVNLVLEFSEDAELLIEQISSALSSGDLGKACEHLHSLKGSCGSLGATSLVIFVSDLKVALERGDSVSPVATQMRMRDILRASVIRINTKLAECMGDALVSSSRPPTHLSES